MGGTCGRNGGEEDPIYTSLKAGRKEFTRKTKI
jgi:hypothetical protein